MLRAKLFVFFQKWSVNKNARNLTKRWISFVYSKALYPLVMSIAHFESFIKYIEVRVLFLLFASFF